MNSYEYDASLSGTHVGREGGRAGQLLCIFKREQETQGTQEHLLGGITSFCDGREAGCLWEVLKKCCFHKTLS